MRYEYWFANIKGISNRRKIEIRKYFQNIEELFGLDEWKMCSLGINDKERNRNRFLPSKIQICINIFI